MAAPAPVPASLPDTPRVFCTMGHGCDFFMEEPNIHRVPDGCTFITLEECGMLSYDFPKIMNAFQDPLLKDALRYPDNRQIRKVLSEYFGVSGSSVIRVHEEKTYYTNPFIDLWLSGKGLIFKSGTYELGRFPNETLHLLKTPRELELGDKLEPHHLSPARVQYIYNGSIFPSAAVAVNERPTTRRRCSELMETVRGIYYFFVCRAPCETPLNYNPRQVINNTLDPLHREILHRGKIRRALSKEVVRAKGDNHENQYGKNENQIEATIIPPGSYEYFFTKWKDVINHSYRRRTWYLKIYKALLEKFRDTQYEAIIRNLVVLPLDVPKFPEIALPSEEVMSQQHDKLIIERERIAMERLMPRFPQFGMPPVANIAFPQGNISAVPVVEPVQRIVHGFPQFGMPPVQRIAHGIPQFGMPPVANIAFPQFGRSRHTKRKTHRKKVNRRIRKQTRKQTHKTIR